MILNKMKDCQKNYAWISEAIKKRRRLKQTLIEGISRSISERRSIDDDRNNRRYWQLSIGQRRRTLMKYRMSPERTEKRLSVLEKSSAGRKFHD